MDVETITIAAIETVGVVQIVKNFMPSWFPKSLYSVIMILLSGLFVYVCVNLPGWVTTSVLTCCVAQIGYEGILQTIKRIANQGNKDQ